MNKFDLDLITVREFAGRMAVFQATIKSALKVGTISKYKKSPPGKILIDFTTESRKFIAASPNPARYSKRAIARRIELHPELAHKYKKGKRLKKQTEDRKKTKFANPLEIPDGEIGLESDPLETRSYRKKKNGSLQNAEDGMLDTMSISTAKASREIWRAKREKLKFELDEARLIDIELVADDWENLAAMFRVRLMELPDRMDAQITGLVRCECGGVKIDRVKINSLLNNECKQILSKVAYDVRNKAKRYSKLKKRKTIEEDDEEEEE